MPILRLPYLYEAKVVRPRHRNPDTFVVRSLGEFDIPEVTSEQAPLATTWVQNDSHAKYGAEYHPNGPHRLVTRFHDGRHYGLVHAEADVGSYVEALSGRVRESRYQHRFAEGYPRQPGITRREDTSWAPAHPTLDELMNRETDGRTRPRHRSDDGVVRLAQAAEVFARTLLVVDGVMWSSGAAREPHFQVVVSAHGDPRVVVDVLRGNGSHRDSLSYVHRFRADRHDDAMAFADHHARRLGVTVKGTTDDVLVHHAPSVTLDHCVSVANQIVSGLSVSTNHFQVRPAGPDVVALVRRLQELKHASAGDVAWASAVIHCAERLIAAMDGDPVADPDDLELHRLDDVMARWRDFERPMRPDVVAHDPADEPDLAGLSL